MWPLEIMADIYQLINQSSKDVWWGIHAVEYRLERECKILYGVRRKNLAREEEKKNTMTEIIRVSAPILKFPWSPPPPSLPSSLDRTCADRIIGVSLKVFQPPVSAYTDNNQQQLFHRVHRVNHNTGNTEPRSQLYTEKWRNIRKGRLFSDSPRQLKRDEVENVSVVFVDHHLNPVTASRVWGLNGAAVSVFLLCHRSISSKSAPHWKQEKPS